MEQIRRCEWAGPDQIYIDYHDNEWGQPLHDDNKLFEMLILEGMQAGLAWITVLKKREAFRAAFDNFDPQKVALYDDAKVEDLMADAGIIRHRGKINAAIGNAKAFLEIQREHGSFDQFIWAYVGGVPVINTPRSMAELPASTPLSDQISKDLKKRGFQYLGSVTVYSHLQACGIINDHVETCFRYKEVMEGADTVRKRRDQEG